MSTSDNTIVLTRDTRIVCNGYRCELVDAAVTVIGSGGEYAVAAMADLFSKALEHAYEYRDVRFSDDELTVLDRFAAVLDADARTMLEHVRRRPPHG